MTTQCPALLLPWSQESESGPSRVKRNYSRFSVVCVVTFHSHRDVKFFPGCTSAIETSPGLSFTLSAAAVYVGHS